MILLLTLAAFIAGCKPPGPRALLDGKRLLEAGDYPQAVAKLEVATSLLATNAQAWNYLGLAQHRAGQWTNAVASYQRALTIDRDLLEARYNLGCLLLDQNKPDAAKAEFTTYTLRRGNAVEGWVKLATAKLRLRDFAGAENSFQEALRVGPQNVEALNGLGLVQLQRNHPREAAKSFADALKQQPDYRPALLNLATVSSQYLNDRAGALQRYRQYLALKPKAADWEAVNAVAQVLEQQLAPPPRPQATNVVARPPANTNVSKIATSAVARVTPPPKVEPPPPVAKTETKPAPAPAPPPVPPSETVKLPPEPVIVPASDISSPGVTTSRPPAQATEIVSGKEPPPEKRGFLSRLNPFHSSPTSATPTTVSVGTTTAGNAKPLADSGPVANPPSTARYTYLAPAKPAAGNHAAAERAFAQAQSAQRAKRLTEAAQGFRQATQLDPAYFEAHYNLGLVTYEARSYRPSLTAWETALALKPDSVDARYNFALALKAANYPTDAANELERILAANPNEARAHLVLGNLYAEQWHDAPRARAHYLKVLELDPKNPQATAIHFWLVANPSP